MDTLTTDEITYVREQRIGVTPDMLTEAALRTAGCWGKVAILPEGTNDRFRELADILVQMIRSTTTDESLNRYVDALCQSLSYLMNSRSWMDGELHDFDADEVKRKLRRVS